MLNNNFLDALKSLTLPKEVIAQVSIEFDIERLSQDSRDLNKHTVFIALFGINTNGHEYLQHASEKGCELAFVDTKDKQEHAQLSLQAPNGMLCIKIFDLQSHLPTLSAIIYRDNRANRHAPVIAAITGTNGKTSVASLSAQLASLCGRKSAIIGTMGVMLYEQGKAQKVSNSLNTTPDIITLHNYIKDLSDKGCEFIYLEASSHGLVLGRLGQLPVAYGVFMNLSQDHLDFHKSMNEYAQAKRKLIKQHELTMLVLNADDAESKNWENEIASTQAVRYFSLSALSQDKEGVWAQDIEPTSQGLQFSLYWNKKDAYSSELPIRSTAQVPLIGQFNVQNILASLSLLNAQGFTLEQLHVKLPEVTGVAGRMELFRTKKASVLVDFAHTPDALVNALEAARNHTKGQLICVFGCGGDRDASKRPLMGKFASQLADKVIITQDNSRSEAPDTIAHDICTGINKAAMKHVHIELNRQQAIINAWLDSQSDDIILLAGKGHEQYIEINHQKRPYVEREFVADIVKHGKHAMASVDASLWSTKGQVRL